MENNFYEKIDEFVAGKLPADEAQKMSEAAAADPELAAEIDWRRAEHELAEAAIAAQIRGQFAGLKSGDVPPPAAPNFWKIGLPAAALLVVAAAFYFFKNFEKKELPTAPVAPKIESETEPAIEPKTTPPPANPLENQSAQPAPRRPKTAVPIAANFEKIATRNYEQPDFSSLRAASSAGDDPIAAAIELIENQKFSEAIARLEAMPAADPQILKARFMLAHLHFSGKKYAASAAQFRALAASKIQPWAEESEWFGLLAGLAAGQRPDADFFKNLERLTADTGHPYHEQAVALAADLSRKN